MNPSQPQTVSDLAARVGGRVIGDGATLIERVASLDTAGTGDIVYVEDEKFFDAANKTRASCLLAPENAALEFPCRIVVAKPKLAFALVAEVLHPSKRHEPSIHDSAVVAESADVALTVYVGPHVSIGEQTQIGGGTQIHSGASIGEHVVVGADCVIHPNVVVYDNVTIGDRVILHAGVVLGADGFGYVRSEQSHHKFPQIGTVIIEDEVELGANTVRRSRGFGPHADRPRNQARQHGSCRTQLRYRRKGGNRRTDRHQRQRHD